MDISSLGFRTDVMVLALGESAIEHHDRHLVARTPRNPTYWWGNFVLFADPVGTGEVDERLELFAAAFPDAGHVALGIDSVDGTVRASFVHYTSKDEVDRLTRELDRCLN